MGNWRRNKGDRKPLLDRFWEKVTPVGDCLIWTGMTLHGKGYGRICSGGSHPQKRILAHHVLKGELPDGFSSHHLCEMKLCVNPTHVEYKPSGEHTAGHNRLRTVAP